jgi:hypothetical protein
VLVEAFQTGEEHGLLLGKRHKRTAALKRGTSAYEHVYQKSAAIPRTFANELGIHNVGRVQEEIVGTKLGANPESPGKIQPTLPGIALHIPDGIS